MIQRKQSLYLLLAAVFISLGYMLPLVEYVQQPDARRFVFRMDALYNDVGVRVPDVDLTVPFSWLYAFLIIALLGLIFLYKNRPRQIRLVRGVLLVILGAFVAQIFAHQSVSSYLGNSISVDYTFLPGFFVPLVAAIFCWLAERGIKADEALVKSMDRLR